MCYTLRYRVSACRSPSQPVGVTSAGQFSAAPSRFFLKRWSGNVVLTFLEMKPGAKLNHQKTIVFQHYMHEQIININL